MVSTQVVHTCPTCKQKFLCFRYEGITTGYICRSYSNPNSMCICKECNGGCNTTPCYKPRNAKFIGGKQVFQ